MPTAPDRACNTWGCRNIALPGTWLCVEHSKQSLQRKRENDRDRADDPIRKLYSLAAWTKHFRPSVLSLNPICQRLIENWATGGGALEQCHEPASEIHHIESPRDKPELFMVYTNVAALCRHCHHKHAGEPVSTRNLYVPTVKPVGYL